MEIFNLNKDTASGIFCDCYEKLIDKNIRSGVYVAFSEEECYLIFDKDYLSYANKLVFLSIACVYNDNLLFADEIGDLMHAINLKSHMEADMAAFDNKKDCLDKKFWFIKIDRSHMWKPNYRAEAVLLYYASTFLRQNPLALDAYTGKDIVDPELISDYEKYLQYPEDLEPYKLIVRLNDESKEFKNPHKVVTYCLNLNTSETLKDIVESEGDEYVSSHFEEASKTFVLHCNPVMNYSTKYKNSKRVGGNKL